MLQLNVKNETSRLRAVVLGTAENNGPTPKLEEAYDPKSLEHIKAGTIHLKRIWCVKWKLLMLFFKSMMFKFIDRS